MNFYIGEPRLEIFREAGTGLTFPRKNEQA